MIAKKMSRSSHSLIRQFPMLLSLSAFLFVVGVLSLLCLMSLMQMHKHESQLWHDQASFDRHYVHTVDRMLQETSAVTRFSIGFNTDDLQSFDQLSGVSGDHDMMIFEQYLSIPGVGQAFGDLKSAYRELKDREIHAISLILHAFEIPEPVMPKLMRDYRLASAELKLDNSAKVQTARNYLFEPQAVYLSEQVWGNLSQMNQAAHRFYNDQVTELASGVYNRLSFLIGLILMMILTVVVSLWVKLSEFDISHRLKSD